MNSLKRGIALATLFSFLTGQAAYAAGPVDLMAALERPSSFQIEIPQELASIEDLYEAPAAQDPRVILHIQNIHGHYESQTQIKKLLAYLYEKYGFKLIFAEGAVEKLNPEYLKFFPDQEHNLMLADYLAKQGELTGVEYYLMDSPADVEAVGIEKAELYRQNYDAFKAVYKLKSSGDQFLSEMDERLELLSSKILKPETRRILSEWKKFQAGHREFLPYIRALAEDAKKTIGLNLESLFSQVEWPQTTRLLVLQSMQKELDLAAAQKDKERLIPFLKSKGVSKQVIEAIEKLDEKRITVSRNGMDRTREDLPRYLFERLAEEAMPKGFKFHDYPAFSLWAGTRIIESEIDSKLLFEEIERIFERILNEIAIRQSEKDLLELYRDADLLKKLFRLELTRHEWDKVQYRKEWIQPKIIARRIGTISRQIGTHRVRMSFPRKRESRTQSLDSRLRGDDKKGAGDDRNRQVASAALKIFEQGFSFYGFARQREDVFYSTIEEKMKASRTNKAVLVTGGFHTDGLADIFRREKINYGVLTPRLTGSDFDNAGYISSMLETKPTIFDLATLENILIAQSADAVRSEGRNIATEAKMMVNALTHIAPANANWNAAPYFRNRDIRAETREGGVQITIPRDGTYDLTFNPVTLKRSEARTEISRRDFLKGLGLFGGASVFAGRSWQRMARVADAELEERLQVTSRIKRYEELYLEHGPKTKEKIESNESDLKLTSEERQKLLEIADYVEMMIQAENALGEERSKLIEKLERSVGELRKHSNPEQRYVGQYIEFYLAQRSLLNPSPRSEARADRARSMVKLDGIPAPHSEKDTPSGFLPSSLMPRSEARQEAGAAVIPGKYTGPDYQSGVIIGNGLADEPKMKANIREMWQAIIEASKEEPRFLVDLATGAGLVPLVIFEKEAHPQILAVDYSLEMLQRSKRNIEDKFPERVGDIQFRQIDLGDEKSMAALQPAIRNADVVTAANILNFYRAPESRRQFLTNMLFSLKPGSLIAIAGRTHDERPPEEKGRLFISPFADSESDGDARVAEEKLRSVKMEPSYHKELIEKGYLNLLNGLGYQDIRFVITNWESPEEVLGGFYEGFITHNLSGNFYILARTPLVRSEVRSAWPVEEPKEVEIAIDVRQMIERLREQWVTIEESEQEQLLSFLEQVHVKVPALEANGAQLTYNFFDSPSFQILKNLFSPLPESEWGPGKPRSRFLNILQAMKVSLDRRTSISLEYHVSRLNLSYLGEGDNRYVDRVSVSLEGKTEKSFTASLYHEYTADAQKRANTEIEQLKEIYTSDSLHALRQHFQEPYGISDDPATRTLIVYKSYIPGITLRSFAEYLISRNIGSEVLTEAFAKAGDLIGQVEALTGKNANDTHDGNLVVREVRTDKELSLVVANIDQEGGFVASENPDSKASDVVQLLDSFSRRTKKSPQAFHDPATAFLAHYFAAAQGKPLQEVRPIVSKVYNETLRPHTITWERLKQTYLNIAASLTRSEARTHPKVTLFDSGMIAEINHPRYKTYVLADPLFSVLEFYDDESHALAVPKNPGEDWFDAVDTRLIRARLEIGSQIESEKSLGLAGMRELQALIYAGDSIFVRASSVDESKRSEVEEILLEERYHLSINRLDPLEKEAIFDQILKSKSKWVQKAREFVSRHFGSDIPKELLADEALALILLKTPVKKSNLILNSVFRNRPDLKAILDQVRSDIQATPEDPASLFKARQLLKKGMQGRNYSDLISEFYKKLRSEARSDHQELENAIEKTAGLKIQAVEAGPRSVWEFFKSAAPAPQLLVRLNFDPVYYEDQPTFSERGFAFKTPKNFPRRNFGSNELVNISDAYASYLVSQMPEGWSFDRQFVKGLQGDDFTPIKDAMEEAEDKIYLSFFILEFLKNAISHGNQLDLNQPVYALSRFGDGGLSLQFFDTAQPEKNQILKTEHLQERDAANQYIKERLELSGENKGVAWMKQLVGDKSDAALFRPFLDEQGRPVGTVASITIPLAPVPSLRSEMRAPQPPALAITTAHMGSLEKSDAVRQGGAGLTAPLGTPSGYSDPSVRSETRSIITQQPVKDKLDEDHKVASMIFTPPKLRALLAEPSLKGQGLRQAIEWRLAGEYRLKEISQDLAKRIVKATGDHAATIHTLENFFFEIFLPESIENSIDSYLQLYGIKKIEELMEDTIEPQLQLDFYVVDEGDAVLLRLVDNAFGQGAENNEEKRQVKMEGAFRIGGKGLGSQSLGRYFSRRAPYLEPRITQRFLDRQTNFNETQRGFIVELKIQKATLRAEARSATDVLDSALLRYAQTGELRSAVDRELPKEVTWRDFEKQYFANNQKLKALVEANVKKLDLRSWVDSLTPASRRNLWRIVDLFDLYLQIAKRSDQEAAALAKVYERVALLDQSGWLTMLVEAKDSRDFDEIVRAGIMAAKMGSEFNAQVNTEVIQAWYDRLEQNLSQIQNAIQLSMPIILLFAIRQNIAENYLQAEGWQGWKTVGLLQLIAADPTPSMRPVILAAAYQAVFRSSIYENVRYGFTIARQHKAEVEEYWLQDGQQVRQSENALKIFGRTPHERDDDNPVWFPRGDSSQEAYNAGMELAAELRAARDDEDVRVAIRNFHNKHHPAGAQTEYRALLLQQAPQALGDMMLTINQQLVSAGYHVELYRTDNGFEVVDSHVLAYRFVRTQSGQEFVELFLDAETPKALGFQLGVQTTNQITVDYYTDGGYVGSERYDHKMQWHFVRVYVKGVIREAQRLGVDPLRSIGLVADHEIEHGFRFLDGSLGTLEKVQAIAMRSPLVAEVLKEKLEIKADWSNANWNEVFVILNELSSAFREAVTDYDLYLKGVPQHRHYRIPLEIISRIVGTETDATAREKRLRGAFSNIFQRSLGDINFSDFVLPRYGNDFMDAMEKRVPANPTQAPVQDEVSKALEGSGFFDEYGAEKLAYVNDQMSKYSGDSNKPLVSAYLGLLRQLALIDFFPGKEAKDFKAIFEAAGNLLALYAASTSLGDLKNAVEQLLVAVSPKEVEEFADFSDLVTQLNLEMLSSFSAISSEKNEGKDAVWQELKAIAAIAIPNPEGISSSMKALRGNGYFDNDPLKKLQDFRSLISAIPTINRDLINLMVNAHVLPSGFDEDNFYSRMGRISHLSVSSDQETFIRDRNWRGLLNSVFPGELTLPPARAEVRTATLDAGLVQVTVGEIPTRAREDNRGRLASLVERLPAEIQNAEFIQIEVGLHAVRDWVAGLAYGFYYLAGIPDAQAVETLVVYASAANHDPVRDAVSQISTQYPLMATSEKVGLLTLVTTRKPTPEMIEALSLLLHSQKGQYVGVVVPSDLEAEIRMAYQELTQAFGGRFRVGTLEEIQSHAFNKLREAHSEVTSFETFKAQSLVWVDGGEAFQTQSRQLTSDLEGAANGNSELLNQLFILGLMLAAGLSRGINPVELNRQVAAEALTQQTVDILYRAENRAVQSYAARISAAILQIQRAFTTAA